MANERTTVKSAARVLDLLEFFSSGTDPLGVSEISKRLGTPKSSTYMLLITLEQRGFLVRDSSSRFGLHPSFSPDARAWIGGSRGRLLQLARGSMQDLVDALDESCFLSIIRADFMSEYIAKIASSQELRLDPPLGLAREPNAGSGGLVLLAYLPGEALERFFATHALRGYTANTLREPRRLRRELALIRGQGYAVAEGTNYSHATGVAAPIRNRHGAVIAALSIGAPTTRLQPVLQRAIQATIKAAAAISRDLARKGS